ncbi:MAG: heme exporter protein CcmB [Pseudomonadota bacterium]
MSGPALPGLIDGFGSIIRRDLLLLWRRPGDLLNPLVFFIMVSTLFPLAVGPDAQVLRNIGAGVTWVAALLSMLLSLNTLFLTDFEDGSLDQLLLSPQPLPLLALGKTVAHWISTGLPLVVVSPLIVMTYKLPSEVVPVMMGSVALGTASLSLVGAIGAALTVGLHRGTTLLSLLLLPLAMPLLIFGARTVSLAAGGEPYAGGMNLLAAYLVGALALAPFATAAALRISNE